MGAGYGGVGGCWGGEVGEVEKEEEGEGEGGGEEDGEGGHGVRRERFLVGVGLVELGVGLYGPSR